MRGLELKPTSEVAGAEDKTSVGIYLPPVPVTKPMLFSPFLSIVFPIYTPRRNSLRVAPPFQSSSDAIKSGVGGFPGSTVRGGQSKGDRIVVRPFNLVVYPAGTDLYWSAHECPVDLAARFK